MDNFSIGYVIGPIVFLVMMGSIYVQVQKAKAGNAGNAPVAVAGAAPPAYGNPYGGNGAAVARAAPAAAFVPPPAYGNPYGNGAALQVHAAANTRAGGQPGAVAVARLQQAFGAAQSQYSQAHAHGITYSPPAPAYSPPAPEPASSEKKKHHAKHDHAAEDAEAEFYWETFGVIVDGYGEA